MKWTWCRDGARGVVVMEKGHWISPAIVCVYVFIVYDIEHKMVDTNKLIQYLKTGPCFLTRAVGLGTFRFHFVAPNFFLPLATITLEFSWMKSIMFDKLTAQWETFVVAILEDGDQFRHRPEFQKVFVWSKTDDSCAWCCVLQTIEQRIAQGFLG